MLIIKGESHSLFQELVLYLVEQFKSELSHMVAIVTIMLVVISIIFNSKGKFGMGTDGPVQKLDTHGNIAVNDGVVHTSDRRLKKDNTDLDASFLKGHGLRGVNYFWKDTEKNSDLQIGVIAQELEAIFPELVNNDGEYKSVNYTGLIPLFIEAIKEQQEQIDLLESRKALLESKMDK